MSDYIMSSGDMEILNIEKGEYFCHGKIYGVKELIHCKDCQFCYQEENRWGKCNVCLVFNRDWMREDDYCSFAKRRKNG